MDIQIEGVEVSKINNGILFSSNEAFYALSNRKGYDFKYVKEFDNHYYNNPDMKIEFVSKHGISVVSSVEFFEQKYFTNLSLFLDVELDNLTLLNIYRTVTETISTIMSMTNHVNKDELSNKLGNYYNVIFVACKSKTDKGVPFDISLYYEIKELVEIVLTKSFEKIIIED